MDTNIAAYNKATYNDKGTAAEQPQSPDSAWKPIARILLEQKSISEEELKEALMLQEIIPGKLLGEILLEKRYVSEADIMKAVALQYNCAYIEEIDINQIDDELVELIDDTKDLFLDKCFIILKGGGKPKVAVYKPDFEISTRIAKFIPDYELLISTKSAIYDAINSKYYANKAAGKGDASGIIREAIAVAKAKKSANIRIKYTSEGFYINYDTIYGTVSPIKTIDIKTGQAVINILAGYCKITLVPGKPSSSKFLHDNIDMRVEFLPVETLSDGNIFEAVIRIHYSYSKDLFEIDRLGFPESKIKELKQIRTYSSGIVIATGPTGAGKSTTFYAVIKYLAQMRKQIFTIEDPIESHFSEINITQLAVKESFDFSDAIRSVLRCEPKIIMIGEVRDNITAELTVQASDTGHLVLTTVHTNSALSCFKRLESLGVKPSRIIDNVRMVTAQRLYIELCENCKIPRLLSKDERVFLKNSKIEKISLYTIENVYERNHNGCPQCNYTGYKKNRKAIIEIAVFDDEMRLVAENSSPVELEREFINKRGFIPLNSYAYNLLSKGKIDINQYYMITNK